MKVLPNVNSEFGSLDFGVLVWVTVRSEARNVEPVVEKVRRDEEMRGKRRCKIDVSMILIDEVKKWRLRGENVS